MIFYFSGTGNSLDAAMRIQKEDEILYNITDCIWEKKFFYEIRERESVGFVFPVYFGGLPSIVHAFLSQVKFSRTPIYTYAVLTCGGSAAGAGHMTARTLEKNGLKLDAAWTVVMPDNYILLYEPDTEEEKMAALDKAAPVLEDIRMKVENRILNDTRGSGKGRVLTAAMYPLYAHGRKTKKFWTDHQCVGCGTCVGRCPAKAMIMESGRPKWVKERCIHCMACIRCGAVQYGKKTVGRYRYKNPVLKKCH
ncbi:MAG: EFR1 family ferrodoxin [Lachnospiraceae bacterium]|nr:EFR1 family ferrodoxin [Lachnospiraceae bacterium]